MINQAYKLLLGLLSGMTFLLSFIFLMTKDDPRTFVSMYRNVCKGINIALIILASLTLILCLALTHMWKHVIDERQGI